jgi:hypothetical protein
MTSSILFAGGEDIDFNPINTAWPNSTVSSISTGSVGSIANFGFRTGYARNSIQIINGNVLNVTTYFRNAIPFSASNFWMTCRISTGVANTSLTAGACVPIRFVDSNGIVRLWIKYTGTYASPNDTFIVQKVDSSGTATTLGSTSTGRFGAGGTDKIDVNVNYGTSGYVRVYLGGTLTLDTGTVDTTTNSVTSLSYFDFGQAAYCSGNGSAPCSYWSEMIVATRDTRNFSLVTQAPTANGNTHNWDGGTATNAAATLQLTGQTSPQYSGTAGQIQEYQVTPAIPTGSFGVISVVHKTQATLGSTGPQHFDFMVRTGSTDYTSSPDAAPGATWGSLSYNWDTNPNTSAPWLTTDLPASSTSFNMGLKSVT